LFQNARCKQGVSRRERRRDRPVPISGPVTRGPCL